MRTLVVTHASIQYYLTRGEDKSPALKNSLPKTEKIAFLIFFCFLHILSNDYLMQKIIKTYIHFFCVRKKKLEIGKLSLSGHSDNKI